MLAAAVIAETNVEQNSPTPISLEDAINSAVSNNLAMMELKYSLASSEIILQSRMDRFRINVRPQIASEQTDGSRSDSAGLTVSKETPIGTELEASAASVKTNPDDIDAFYRSSVRIQIKQPLLRRIGTRVNLEPVRIAERGVLNSRREIALRQTDLIVQVAESHESLISLQRQIEYQIKTVDRLSKFLKLTSAREKQGRSTRVDTMRADLRLGNARLRIASLQDQLINEQTAFAELIGADPGVAFTATPSDMLIIDVPSPDNATASALSNRLDLAQILDDYEDAERGVRIARQNMLPDLSIIARYELSGEGESQSESTKMDDDVWFVGFQLTSDFPRRNEASTLTQAKLTKDLGGLKIERVTLAIKKQVLQAISTYRRILIEKELANKNYTIASDRARLARKLFEMGKGDSFSVSEAEDELLSAEEQLLSSQAAASVASYKLMRVTGTLIEYPSDLKPGTRK